PISLNEWEYRNKLALPFGKNKRSGRVYLGFFEKRSHSVVPMKWCALQGQWAADLIEDIGEWANEEGLSVYDEQTGRGYLRHAVARMLDTLTLTIVVNSGVQNIEKLALLTQKLDRHFAGYTVFVSNNTKNTNVIMGENATLVYGEERPQDLGRYKAVVSPLSFLQVNNKVRDAIYDDVCEHIGTDFDGEIVELYSGVGLLTAQIALRLPKAKITAVEIVKEATKNADALMRNLAIGNVHNVCADAAKFVENIKDDNTKRVLVLDPPRKGCDERVLAVANNARFDKILYVSCNPQTLARDLKTLSSTYHIDSVQPYDMFPQTHHIETFVCMKRSFDN
ncbi:MAG: 23S rRNA (uracil(1939)-C(5))-methyltransferase RlmD, partial [Clostridia bacterium]|nr:23S rRNA (uracil(1939)-C(5))-methyltransferase RlmD [Clostridia bacterium]